MITIIIINVIVIIIFYHKPKSGWDQLGTFSARKLITG